MAGLPRLGPLMHETAARPLARFPGFTEFVVLMAALMALNAFAIDAMLPALPAIGAELGVAEENQRQLVVIIYMLGFGGAQMLWGPLADRFGRRPVLLAGLVSYTLFAAGAALSSGFSGLLAFRFLQGAAAASTRVLVVSVVRDRFEGAQMARIMSLTFLVFMAVPVFAPTLGTAILAVAPWRWIFGALASAGLLMLVWAGLRLPETLDPANRRAFSVAEIAAGTRETLTTRASIGYTLAFTCMMGALMSYVSSSQQIVFDYFRRPDLFAIVFGAVAAPMALTSWLNSRLVVKLGTRRLAHWGLLAFTSLAALHWLVALRGDTLASFIILQALVMASFSFASSNMGALAMQPLGHVAGTASSVQGSLGTIGGAAIGFVVGQSFNGTPVPMLAGFALMGAAALGVVLWTERGRLALGGSAPAALRAGG